MIKYIGSKRALLTQIASAVSGRLPDGGLVCDLFSGTARVGHALKKQGFRVWSNDHNAYAHALATCYVQADRERWAAPELRHLFDARHRVGILPAVLKPRLRQQLLSTAHIRRAVWPGPDKDVQLAERRRRVGSHHQPGDFRPRVHPPSLLLNMAVPAQKQLPLQHAVGQFTGRHFRQRRDLPRSGGPCLTA